MPSRPMRGLTTQKLLSSTSMGSACDFMRALMMTRDWSSESDTDSTWPISTLRVLIRVLPASMPSALSMVRVISGPRLA
ncbi:hypothetical protein A8U91_00908 [Halomonas elongata]|uniref:Uncharacterized protein n=1 Tax=Halomonas elongata TaxID=2746 RepID=A0A1B8P2Q0_HALEL|nr:hypothetical protein A8U91_00908 [Halomonas elongata]